MPRRHDIISSTIASPRDDGNLWDHCFSKGVEDLCPMSIDATPFLRRAKKIAGHVHERDDEDVECITKLNEASIHIVRVDISCFRMEMLTA